jgi:hypothetical protein
VQAELPLHAATVVLLASQHGWACWVLDAEGSKAFQPGGGSADAHEYIPDAAAVLVQLQCFDYAGTTVHFG